jgi:hypothetical protein
VTPLDDELNLLENMIRKLQIEWDKFFGGLERKPPNDLKSKVEAQIRKYAFGEIRNATDRFRYQSLTARYNVLGEYWNKRLRAMEEGKVFWMHGLKADALPPPPPPPPAEPSPAPEARAAQGQRRTAASAGGEVRIQSPEKDTAALVGLYKRFLEERQRTGESTAVKFDSFQKLIAQQASRILGERGATAVDFRLETKDGKVSLKAKAVK